MVHFPTGFDVSEAAAGRPFTLARIGHQSFIRDLLPSDVSVSTELDDAPKDALLRPDTGEFWEPEFLPATWKVNLGASRSINYMGIAGHNIGTRGVTIHMETSTDDTSYATFGSDAAVSPSDDNPLLFLDDATTAQFIRITLTTVGASLPPRIASIYAGQVLVMENEVTGPHNPMGLARDTELFRSLSRGGQFLGQSFRRHGVLTQMSFQFLTSSWVRSNFDPFIEDARQFPYFLAWRIQDFPQDVGYVWTPNDIRPVYMGSGPFMQVDWTVMGIANA